MSAIAGAAAIGSRAHTATTDRAITAGITVRIFSAPIITRRAIMAADIAVAGIITAATTGNGQRGGFGPLFPSRPRYSAAKTALVTSAVPLLPPNSNGLMPPA